MRGFFWLPGGATIRPLPAPCFVGVTVLAPSAIRPTMGSKETLGFLGARSPFDGILLLIDNLLEPIPMGSVSAPLFLAACSLIAALPFASSISKKKKTGKVGHKHKLFKQKENDRLTLSSSLFVFNCCLSRFESVTIPMDGVKVDELGPGSSFWLRLCKNSLKKVKLLEINLWAPSD